MDAPDIYALLKQALDTRQPTAIATVVQGVPLGAKLLILPDRTVGTLGNPVLDDIVAIDAQALLAAERSETRPYDLPGRAEAVEVFVETFPPPPLLLIFGAVHVAQALCRLAKHLDFTVYVSDARAPLATTERFPEADRIIQAWPDDALRDLAPELAGGRTVYVAILTHDPKFDEPALVGALATTARYIGAVGSRKTNHDRRHRLVDAGVSPDSLARIRGPIGLDIGAETPEEMAISILSEIIAVRHDRHGGPLTRSSGNIRGPQE